MDIFQSLTAKKIGSIGALIGLMSYVVPYLSITKNFPLFDAIFAIGISIGFGVALVSFSIELKTRYEYISMSVGVFMLDLGLIFIADINKKIDTDILIIINIINTLICLLYLFSRKKRTQL